MYRITEEDDVLTIQDTPWSIRVIFIALIVIGLGALYLFSMSARIECQRDDSTPDTCIVYKTSAFGIMHEDSFSLADFSEARAVEASGRGAAHLDLVLKNRTIRFSYSRMGPRDAIALANTINGFVKSPDARALIEEQEPDFFPLIMGIFSALLGIIGLPIAGRKVWIRFDAGTDVITARKGFLRARVQEFKVSDLDHAEIWTTNESKSKKLAFIFRDGTVFHFEHYSTKEDLSTVVQAVDAFVQKHVTKPEFNSGW